MKHVILAFSQAQEFYLDILNLEWRIKYILHLEYIIKLILWNCVDFNLNSILNRHYNVNDLLCGSFIGLRGLRSEYNKQIMQKNMFKVHLFLIYSWHTISCRMLFQTPIVIRQHAATMPKLQSRAFVKEQVGPIKAPSCSESYVNQLTTSTKGYKLLIALILHRAHCRVTSVHSEWPHWSSASNIEPYIWGEG